MSNSDLRVAIISAITGIASATLAASTGLFGFLNKDRSLDIELVRISLSILTGENKDESIYGRKFALRTLSEYSGIEIPRDEFDEWAKSGTIALGAPVSAGTPWDATETFTALEVYCGSDEPADQERCRQALESLNVRD